MDFKQILKGLIISVIAVVVASKTASGIYYDDIEALAVAIVLLGVFNIFLKPLLMLFSLPFIVLTLGLGIWIINAMLFYLAGAMVDGFHVESFASALWGALVLSIINFIVAIYSGDSQTRNFKVNINRSARFGGKADSNGGSGSDGISRRSKESLKDDDVIDI